MKEIMGNEARVYNYMENVFKTVSDYYGYEYVKMPIIKNGDTTEQIKEYYLNNIKDGFKKYCYLGINSDERDVFSFLTLNIDSIYQDAEIISMNYRILEELKLEDIIVYIKASKNYNLKKLQEYLEQLDVDYEISDSGDLLDDNISMSFEIVMELRDKKIVLAGGYRNTDEPKCVICVNYLDNILEVLNVIYEDYSFDTLTQVTIIAEKEEERIAAMKLAQDLRWCEIKVDVDTNNSSKDEQLKDINSNFIIVIEENDLNKGLIKVIDNKTHEETLVDENEIIDYIVSNI